MKRKAATEDFIFFILAIKDLKTANGSGNERIQLRGGGGCDVIFAQGKSVPYLQVKYQKYK